ncbi:unnamed protein product, partial [Hymenolepis diminuta]
MEANEANAKSVRLLVRRFKRCPSLSSSDSNPESLEWQPRRRRALQRTISTSDKEQSMRRFASLVKASRECLKLMLPREEFISKKKISDHEIIDRAVQVVARRPEELSEDKVVLQA